MSKELEYMFDKNTLISKLKSNMCLEIKLLVEIDSLEIETEYAVHILTHLLLLQKCHITTIVGILTPTTNVNQSISNTLNDILTLIHADLIDATVDGNLYSVIKQDELEKRWIAESQYPLPLLTEPKEIEHNHESPYQTYNKHCIMGSFDKKHNEDICLDHINRLNSIKLTLDESVIFKAKNKWKSDKSLQQLKDFTKKETDVINAIIIHGNEFYMSHGYDNRGRTYCRGYLINYMGNQYQKSLIQLANKELIND